VCRYGNDSPATVAARARLVYGRRMVRAARIVIPNGVYHVFTRGNNRAAIVDDDDDCRLLVRLVEHVGALFQWIYLAYCVMPNHLHLVVQTREPNLSQGMHRLLSRYAQAFNERHDRSGHVFQGRFNSRLLDSDESVQARCKYVLDNPAEAGLGDPDNPWPYVGGVAAARDVRGQTPDAG
jgi:putative transposase